MKRADRFFAYARERYQIHLNRSAGLPRPWTKDKILQEYKFCNIFREDDRTTRWFAEHVREPLRDRPEVLLATVVFRMFNRITTGEAVFCQTDLAGGGLRSVFKMKGEYVTAFDLFLHTGKVSHLRRAILAHCGRGPYVTGAYIISSPPGYAKLNGVLRVLEQFSQLRWRGLAGNGTRSDFTLEQCWELLKEAPYLGKFHSYEIVTDLRHTRLLERAPDIMTWASPGPGARRGLNRVFGKDYKDKGLSRDELIAGMRELLVSAGDARLWPSEWPRWEMRDVEHTLCEFDKYERMRLGQGRMKGKYK